MVRSADSAPTTVPAWPDMDSLGPLSMYPTLDQWYGDILALSGTANNDQSFYFRCVGMRPIRACTAAARSSSAGSGRSLTDSLARSLTRRSRY